MPELPINGMTSGQISFFLVIFIRMKTTLVTILFFALLGCKEVTYPEPQPRGVKALESVPKSLTGKYPLPEEDGPVIDTLIIEASGYYFAKDDDKGNLGSDLVLKKYKGYYFINLNSKPQWFLRVIKQEKNGTLTIISMENSEANFSTLVNDLSKDVKVDTVMNNEDTYYQINPTPQQLMSLIKKGYFKTGPVLKKIKE